MSNNPLNKDWTDKQISDWLSAQGWSKDRIKSYLRGWQQVKGK